MIQYRVLVRKPTECSDSEISDFVRIVEEAGEVGNGVEQRARNAAFLIMMFAADQMVGTAAIKNPNSSYRAKIFRKAGLESEAVNYQYELGWIHIRQEHQGRRLASPLVEKTLSYLHDKQTFATTRESNAQMRRVLEKVGFVRCGKPYSSTQSANEIILLYLKRSSG